MMDYSVFMGDPPRVCDGPPDVMAKISVSPKEVQYKGFLVHLVRGLQLFLKDVKKWPFFTVFPTLTSLTNVGFTK